MREQQENQRAVMDEFQKPPARTAEQLMQLLMHSESGRLGLRSGRVRAPHYQLCAPIAAVPSTTRSPIEFWRDHL
jgi:hypothetical protein